MKGIKLVIFDLDGTLVDAYPAITSSFNFVMKKLGYPQKRPAFIRRAVGRGDKNLLKPFLLPADLKKGIALYRNHHRLALLSGSRLLARTRPLLAYLKTKGYKLAVASNRPTKFSRIILEHLGISAYFDYVLCADTLKQGKPHPEILRKIMRRFSLKPKQTVFVGDMTIDARTGRRSGVRTVILTGGSSSKDEIKRQKPYAVISKITDLRHKLRL